MFPPVTSSAKIQSFSESALKIHSATFLYLFIHQHIFHKIFLLVLNFKNPSQSDYMWRILSQDWCFCIIKVILNMEKTFHMLRNATILVLNFLACTSWSCTVIRTAQIQSRIIIKNMLPVREKWCVLSWKHRVPFSILVNKNWETASLVHIVNMQWDGWWKQ